ncbi:MAG: hypothetical protein K6E19_04135 [Lachnospiraceae bacterium]|nr:hypothetical protein [Lachnospiraceae bacterium]
MSMMRFNYRSQMLGHYVDISIVYPTDNYSYYDPKKDRKGIHDEGHFETAKLVYEPGMKFQTVYLIHGGGDDDTLTYRYTNAERYAQDNNVMLVTPNIANSFGANAEYGKRYQDFLGDELPAVIQSLFASSSKREDNFIMGYAMGGNVALATALLHQDKFAYCVDMSGGIGLTLDTKALADELRSDHFKNFLPIYNGTFGNPDKLEGSRHDIYKAAKEYKESGKELTGFHVICGSDEFIRKRVERDVELLKELGYNPEYTVAEGYKHDFDLWEDYMRIALDSILPLKRKKEC